MPRSSRTRSPERMAELQAIIGRWIETPLAQDGTLRVPPGGSLHPRRLRAVLGHFWLHAALQELATWRPRREYVRRFVARARQHLRRAMPTTLEVVEVQRQLYARAHDQLHVDDDSEDEAPDDTAHAVAFLLVEAAHAIQNPNAALARLTRS